MAQLVAMSIDKIIEAMLWCRDEFIEKSKEDCPSDYSQEDWDSMISCNLDDASQYQTVVDLLTAGDVKGGLHHLSHMDTYPRGYMWAAPVVLADEVSFAEFLEVNQYPNRLSEYVFF